ncbi:hypothetical protein ACIQVU_02255 [Lysinibacillus sp. NPDC098008]|uniref:hypothetical protein n=1 Tax=Lysinibacillus sp. NPDC098008 TaxID=3364146 RepID=UPI00382BDD5A
MIGKVGQTSSDFFENTLRRNPIKQMAQSTTKTDEFIRSSGKSDLWNYSMKEVKSPILRSYSTFGSLPEPDWRTIPTKGGRTLSNEEMLEQMKMLAQREAMMRHTNNYEQSDSIAQIKQYLSTQYISDVSPDRKALYTQAKKISQQGEQEQSKYPLSFTLVDIMCDLDKVEGFNNNYGTLTTCYTTGYGTDYELNMGGQCVLSTSRGIWQYHSTPLEGMKREEFYKIYNKELASAQRSLDNQQ